MTIKSFWKTAHALACAMWVGVATASWSGNPSATAPATTVSGGKVYYRIATPEDLAWFAAEVNGGRTSVNAILVADLYFGTAAGTVLTPASANKKWTPIGNAADKAFLGTIDGNGHAVYGLYARGADFDAVGLVGYLGAGGRIVNLTVGGACFSETAHSSGSSVKAKVGGIVGQNDGGTVAGCAARNVALVACVTTNAKGQDGWTVINNVGGIVGWNKSGTVDRCQASGDVVGYYAGGIVGLNDGAVSNSIGRANVSVMSSDNQAASDNSTGYGGGVVGRSLGTVESCAHEDSSVTALQGRSVALGAIAGGVSGTVRNCCLESGSSLDAVGETGAGAVVENVAAGKVLVCLAANDDSLGTVSGAGMYDLNASVTVSATAKTGGRFVQWSDTALCPEAESTFTATGHMSLTSYFASEAPDVSVVICKRVLGTDEVLPGAKLAMTKETTGAEVAGLRGIEAASAVSGPTVSRVGNQLTWTSTTQELKMTLPIGTYTVDETEAPEGYLPTNMTFEVRADGKVYADVDGDSEPEALADNRIELKDDTPSITFKYPDGTSDSKPCPKAGTTITLTNAYNGIPIFWKENGTPIGYSYTVPEVREYTFTAEFVTVSVDVPVVLHTTAEVYTNDVKISEPYTVYSNAAAYVVYKAEPGYFFEGGITEKTNTVDTSLDPAQVQGTIPSAPVMPHVHCICGDGTCAVAGHAHSDITWQAWTVTDSLPTAAGNWYLENDVTLTSAQELAGDVNLCLNGKVVRQTTAGEGSADPATEIMTVPGNRSFTLTDCGTDKRYFTDTDGDRCYETCSDTVTAGAIETTGGCLTGYRGRRGAIWAKGRFVMYGGNVIGNYSKSLDGEGFGTGGVNVYGESGRFVMYGGAICGNHGNYGGGISVNAQAQAALTNGLISRNYAVSAGGGIRVANSPEVTLAGVEIVENRSLGGGGGLSVGGNGSVTMTSGAIDRNCATNSSGAGVSLHGRFTMTGGTVVGNYVLDNNGDPNCAGIFHLNSAEWSLELGGTACVTGNVVRGHQENVYLAKWASDNRISVSTNTPFAAGARIGLCSSTSPEPYKPVAVSFNGTTDDLAYILRDTPQYLLEMSGDHMILRMPDVEVRPEAVANTTVQVLTNGAPVELVGGKYLVPSNASPSMVAVVYQADEGYLFSDGSTATTNNLPAYATQSDPTLLPAKPNAPMIPVEYTYPIYVDGVASNGIERWETNTCYVYTVVASAASAVTWGAEGVTNWFVVTNDVQIGGGAVCKGYVNLILCQGAKLFVTNKTVDAAGIATDAEGSFTVYGQPDGAGELSAFGGNGGAGIGGGFGISGKNITINGGRVTAVGGESGAGIGGGKYDEYNFASGSGKNITINGGAVTATGGSKAAGIGGGGPSGRGFNLTVNGGTVTANGGNEGAGIGGGRSAMGENITVNGGTVMAVGGESGAGIGGGSSSHGKNIAIQGGTVTAIGGKCAAAIGGGLSGYAQGNITIGNATVFAGSAIFTNVDGSSVAFDIIGQSSSAILYVPTASVADTARIFFNLTGMYDAEGKHESAPMPESFEGMVIMTPEEQKTDRVLVRGVANWTAATTFSLTNAVTGATGTIEVNGESVLFAGRLLKLSCADGKLTLKAYKYSTINPPTEVENTTVTVYTNDAEVAVGSGLLVTNGTPAYVVYKVVDGFIFEDDTTAKTNLLNTTVNPAEMIGGVPPAPVPLVVAEVIYNSVTNEYRTLQAAWEAAQQGTPANPAMIRMRRNVKLTNTLEAVSRDLIH